MKLLCVCLLIVLNINTVYSAAGRITAPTSPVARCVDIGMPDVECEDVRKQAIGIGCITEEEYQEYQKRLIEYPLLKDQIEYLKNLKIILSSFYNIRLNKIMFLIMINLIKILKSISSNN